MPTKQDLFRKTDEGRAVLREQKRNRPVTAQKRARELRHAKKYMAANPVKDSAKRTVRAALLAGYITRPALCENCNTTGVPCRDGRATIHAHHEDYSKPLEVTWLCVLCHAARHRALVREQQNNTEDSRVASSNHPSATGG